jgi:hypothetical protein
MATSIETATISSTISNKSFEYEYDKTIFELWGKETIPYSTQTMKTLCEKLDDEDEDYDSNDAIICYKKYFIKTTDKIFKWEPLSKNKIREISKSEILTLLGTGKAIEFYKNDCNIFTPVVRVDKPLIFFDGELYFNLFRGFAHQSCINKKIMFEDFAFGIQKDCEFLVNFVHKKLCNGNDVQSNFFLNCLAKLSMGKKLNCMIYMKGPEGIGKSMFLNFLRDMFGADIVLKTDEKIVTAEFNSQLVGKLLLLLDELPSHGDMSSKFSTYLKSIVTDDTLKISGKYNRGVNTIDNILSVIISTNHDSMDFHQNERRLFCPDVDFSQKDLPEYFDKMSSITQNVEVQKAFFVYLRELYDKDFKDFSAPNSKTKTEAIAAIVPDHVKFMKQVWLKKKKDIKGRDTVTAYNEFNSFLNDKSTDIAMFRKGMKDIKEGMNDEASFNVRKSNGKLVIDFKCDAVFNFFKLRNWIGENEDISFLYQSATLSKNNVISPLAGEKHLIVNDEMSENQSPNKMRKIELENDNNNEE